MGIECGRGKEEEERDIFVFLRDEGRAMVGELGLLLLLMPLRREEWVGSR